MDELKIDVIERELRRVLEKERRDALEYTVLTVLATPVLIALAATVVTVLISLTFLDAAGLNLYLVAPAIFYTMVNLFLAYMVMFVLVQSNRDIREFEFSMAWIASTALLVLLLVLTYGTPFPRTAPLGFGVA